ncbi:MAG TPA: protein kinase, partial [Pirellulaceae bacterium]|nr:protein kinase [Pirellulaceae bacterium]
MRITCPNCHAPLHIVDGSPAASVTCESCGSRIVLRDDPDETLTLPPLVKGQLEHFELLSELGHGGFGTVWKAHDTRLNRLVAIKVPRGDATTKIDRDRFRREAQALAGLDDPRIVPVYATSHSPPYIVTKFIEGQTLSAAIRAGLDFRRAAEICAEVAEAIEHAHAAGVLHRDLKPRNIMVTPQGAPVVLDFGLARLDGGGEFALTREGEVLGTPEWIAPECLVNNRPDARSDVWSLGVILYEALTRNRPFKAQPGATDHHTLYYQIVHADPLRPTAFASNLPRDLETICLHALEKNPDARYQSAKECAEDLREWLAGRPLKHARRPSAWTRLKTSLRG